MLAAAVYARSGEIITFESADHAELGDLGAALSRNIYDDYSKQFCEQGVATYQEAYARLKNVEWPEPQLEDLELPATITPELLFLGDDEEAEVEVPSAQEVADYIYSEDHANQRDLYSLLSDYFNEDHDVDVPDQWVEVQSAINWRGVDSIIKERIWDEVEQRFEGKSTYAILVPAADLRQIAFDLPDLLNAQETQAEWQRFLVGHSVIGGLGGELAFVQPSYSGAQGEVELEVRSHLELELGWDLHGRLPIILANSGGNSTAFENAVAGNAPGLPWIEPEEGTTYAELREEYGDVLDYRTVSVDLGTSLNASLDSGEMWLKLLLGNGE